MENTKIINDLAKNNPKGYWFKAKTYGWGWTPARWQGWVVIAVYVVLLVKIFTRIDSNSHSGSDTLIGFFIPLVVLSTILIAICYWKGEKPHWQWGPQDVKIKK